MDKIEVRNKTPRQKKQDNSELEKSKSHIIVEIIEYVSNSVVKKPLLKNQPEI